jgi:hypothetical protein
LLSFPGSPIRLEIFAFRERLIDRKETAPSDFSASLAARILVSSPATQRQQVVQPACECDMYRLIRLIVIGAVLRIPASRKLAATRSAAGQVKVGQ